MSCRKNRQYNDLSKLKMMIDDSVCTLFCDENQLAVTLTCTMSWIMNHSMSTIHRMIQILLQNSINMSLTWGDFPSHN
jgi:hypothetical protein